MRTYQDDTDAARPLPATLADSPAYKRVWKWLDADDRLILELASRGVSHRLIGRAVGLVGGSVSRRIGMLHRLVHAPDTQCLLSSACPLSDEVRQVILLKEVSHRSVSQIAVALGLTQGQVRRHIRFAKGVVRGLTLRPLSLEYA